MPQCIAFTKKNTQCSRRGGAFEGHCVTHHEMRRNHDPAYRERWERRGAVAGGGLPETAFAASVALSAGVAAAAAAAEAEAAATAQRRAEKLAANARVMARLNVPTANQILGYSTKLITLWKHERMTDLDCPKAYAVLKYGPILDTPRASVVALLKASVRVYLLSNGHHPDVARYFDVPAAEKEAALVELHAALEPFTSIPIQSLLPTTDVHSATIHERIHEAEQRRRAAAAAAAAAAEEVRRRQLAVDLRERPVVFRRDPEGSIDVRAFAVDPQNVHRSSVQNTTHKACLTLLRRPLEPGQETLPELVADLENPAKIRISSRDLVQRLIDEVTQDYFVTQAFSLLYGDVLDRVWAFLRSHVHRDALFVRLIQEIAEGLGQCSNGKMARLVNALQGFDETLDVDPPKELFQNHIVMLRGRPKAEREERAAALFTEYAIPEAERPAWLEALEEEQEAQ